MCNIKETLFTIFVIILLGISIYLNLLSSVLVEIGAILILVGFAFRIKEKQNKKMIDKRILLIIGGSILIWISYPQLILDANNYFDYMNIFTLGSFSLAIATFSYGKKELANLTHLSSASCVAFFAAGIIYLIQKIVPNLGQDLLNQVILFGYSFNSFFGLFRMSFISLGILSLFLAALFILMSIEKKRN